MKKLDRLEDAQNAKTWTEVEDIMKDIVAAGYPGVINCDAMGTVLNPAGFDNGCRRFCR